VLSSTPPYRLGLRPRVSVGNKTYELHLKTKNYKAEEFISIRQADTVKEQTCHYSSLYSAHLSTHPNGLVVNLVELPDNR
jgi:hypothetical protein